MHVRVHARCMSIAIAVQSKSSSLIIFIVHEQWAFEWESFKELLKLQQEAQDVQLQKKQRLKQFRNQRLVEKSKIHHVPLEDERGPSLTKVCFSGCPTTTSMVTSGRVLIDVCFCFCCRNGSWLIFAASSFCIARSLTGDCLVHDSFIVFF